MKVSKGSVGFKPHHSRRSSSTQLTAPALVHPSFGPVASIQPHQGQAETSDTGEWAAHTYESRGPAQRELETGGQGGSNVDIGQHGRPLAADSVEGTVVDHQETEDEEGKDAEHSSKRKRSYCNCGDRASRSQLLPAWGLAMKLKHRGQSVL